MASIFPLVTFVRLRNVYDSIAQRDSNSSMKFVCKSASNCFPLSGGFSYAALYKFGELLGNYRVEKKNPCPSVQPLFCRKCSCSRVCTPSAMTRCFRLRPMSGGSVLSEFLFYQKYLEPDSGAGVSEEMNYR